MAKDTSNGLRSHSAACGTHLAHCRHDIPFDELRGGLDELTDRGLVAGTRPWASAITPAGCEVLDRLVAARRAHLTELLAEWKPRDQEELAAALRQVAREMIPDPRHPGSGVNLAGSPLRCLDKECDNTYNPSSNRKGWRFRQYQCYHTRQYHTHFQRSPP